VLALPPSATRNQLQADNDGVTAQVTIQGPVTDAEAAVPITVSLSVEVVTLVAASAATSATHHFTSRNEFNSLKLHLFYGKCH
jgi:hypothetical protein